MVVALLILILCVLLLGRERFLRLLWLAVYDSTAALVAALLAGLLTQGVAPSWDVQRVRLSVGIAVLACLVVLQSLLALVKMVGLDPNVLIGRAFGIPEEDVRLDQHFGQRAEARVRRLDFRGFARLARRSVQLFDRRAQRRAQERFDTAHRQLFDLITGVTRRRQLNRLTPAQRAEHEESEAAAGEAAALRREQLPPRERIAVETYLTLLLLQGNKPWPVALTPQQQASVDDTRARALAGCGKTPDLVDRGATLC